MRSMPAIGLPGIAGVGVPMACSAPESTEQPTLSLVRSAEFGQSAAAANNDLIAVDQRVATNAGWEG